MNVAPEAVEAARRAEQSIEQIAREGRKYGMGLLLLVQSSTDYSHSASAIRQNASTRIFLHNTDKEVPYASDWLDDGKEIVRLNKAEALICNPQWGTVKVAIRPPLSRLWQLSDQEVRKLFGSATKTQPTLSRQAQAVLDMAYEYYNHIGKPAKLASIIEQVGISSRRQVKRIINELESTSAAKFERLQERGKPLVIIPTGIHK